MTERDDWAPLSERVRTLRRAKGWSMDRFANEAGVTKGQVELVERGVTKALKKKTLTAYSEALGVPEAYLRDGFVEPPAAGQPWPDVETYLRIKGELRDQEHIEFVARQVQILVEMEQRAREGREDES